jgi:ribosomal protein S18 acetylase RimI-like enzyme
MYHELANGYALKSAPERDFGINYSDIAVHPEYQRRGLATRMLKKALTILKSEYSILRFGVAMGNPAESVYYNLGFLSGVTQYTLAIPSTEL